MLRIERMNTAANSFEVQDRQYLWHDCDPGHDDALALAMATAGEDMFNIKLLGVSTVGGNVTVDKCTINARKILYLAKHDNLDCYTGASQPFVRPCRNAEFIHGECGLGGTTTLAGINLPAQSEKFGDGSAIEAMYKAFMSTPKGSSWLVCTGPLTNAALLLMTYEEEIAEHLAGICFMGGAVTGGNCNSGNEFNMFGDPESAKIVIETWGEKLNKLVMVPLDVTETAVTSRKQRERMSKIEGTLPLTISQLWEKSRFMTAADQPDDPKLQFDGDVCAVIHDPCAIMYVWLP